MASLEELVTEYTSRYSRPRRVCKVCASPNVALIDILLRGGAGTPSIAEFLLDKFDEEIGDTSLRRHRKMHLDRPEDR